MLFDVIDRELQNVSNLNRYKALLDYIPEDQLQTVNETSQEDLRATRLNSGAALKAASGVFDTPSVSGEAAAKGADAPGDALGASNAPGGEG